MTIKKAEKSTAKGTASYFPSIEEKYGKPIDHWFKMIINKMAVIITLELDS